MLPYTICFIKRKNDILLLNRNQSPNLGLWNGVGGKLENDETADACVLREVKEETGIILSEVNYKGMITWNVDDLYNGGMYAYMATVPDTFEYDTPISTREGILEWKNLDWILLENNRGVVSNIRYFLPHMLKDDQIRHHHFIYKNEKIVSCICE
ncbi:MAG TPA: 8-oxo-dGTP diphosphatase [Cerasibacillus sp.]|uniref:NUDIX hydrolase n=1 Tax=Cerasibacillus sp. TaxID=2498711 RepID=UPI002F417905